MSDNNPTVESLKQMIQELPDDVLLNEVRRIRNTRYAPKTETVKKQTAKKKTEAVQKVKGLSKKDFDALVAMLKGAKK